MNASQRIHMQELTDKKHLAVHKAYQNNPKDPDFCKSWFYDFLIMKYQDFCNVPRETFGG